MGNNTSTLPDAVIDDSPILTTQDWSLHHAESTDHGPLSVFIGKKSSQDSSLCSLAKGLKQYRHPSILKYYAWAPNGSQIYLFTEKVCPISLVRSQQNPYSTGLGIFQICQAVKFLHETGGVTHGNLIENSILITPCGEWKLAGLESVHKIPENKPGSAQLHKDSEMLRDILALGILFTELLSRFTDRESMEFNEYAKSNLLLPDLSRRPNICQVLEQPYFQQEYIQIFQFLKDLTLKTEKEKEDFFSCLGERLFTIPQQVLGQHFAKPLLSRYVMMDLTARSKLVPRILQPRSSNPDSIFADEYFSDYVVPEIKTLFLVYDSGIRLILLENFSSFCKSIDIRTLEEDILPALILGLKDTNPVIVSETLRSLADIVPILGPEKVIGKNTSRIFSDGSPSRRINRESINISWKPQQPTGIHALDSSSVSFARNDNGKAFAHGAYAWSDDERMPPIGAEMDDEVEANNLEEWDDWEDDAVTSDKDDQPCLPDDQSYPAGDLPYSSSDHLSPPISLSAISLPSQYMHQTFSVADKIQDDDIKTVTTKVQEIDLLNLDVKLPPSPKKPRKLSKPSSEEMKDEVDFFADMTPDIPKKSSDLDRIQQQISSHKMEKFAAVADDGIEGTEEGEGWGDDDDW